MTKTAIFKTICSTVLVLATYAVTAQEQFKSTLIYNDSIGSPKATLQDVSWIKGSWKGKALGGIVEEVWTPPLGNSMMCTFKLVVNGRVQFYEFITISEEKETLIMKLKHFDNNLHGWEKKEETVDFKLVKVTPNKVYFDGFTFEKVSESEMIIYVIFKQKTKNVPATFKYKKVKS